MSKIKVIAPGLCTTIQDAGRVGYQQFGVPVSGVMDKYSFLVANYLVGNEEEKAVLEIPYLGPTLEFDFDVTIAITGGNLTPKLNNNDIEMWRSINIKAGDKLSFKGLKSGVRAYIAFSADIDVPLVNGSKSTLMKAKLGGLEGRQLKKGDELLFSNVRVLNKENILPKEYIPNFAHSNEIRVVLGPQEDYFTEAGIKTFFSSEYTISKNSDRMGMRLEGAKIEHKNKADIISDATVFGSIQVPGDGMPIVLLADRQTTGGYSKIGTVIHCDLPKLVQMSPNDKISFKEISVEKAQEEYKKFYENLAQIKKLFGEAEKSKCIFKRILSFFKG